MNQLDKSVLKLWYIRAAIGAMALVGVMIGVFVILIGSTIGIGVLSAKIYRVGVLLYGTPPKIGTILKTVFKR